jgi:ATP-binding cassette subfamily B protein
MEKQSRKYSTPTIYARLILQARPYWAHVLGYLVLSLLATPLALLVPVPLKLTVDCVIGDKPLPAVVRALLPARMSVAPETAALLFVAGLVITIVLLTQIHQTAVNLLKTYVGEKLVIGFRSRLFRHVQQLSLTYHDRRGTSDSIYRIQYDAMSIQMIVVESVIPLISAVTMLAGMLYVTARLSPKLALIAVAVCPPLLILTSFYRRRLRKQWHDVKKLESSAQSVVQEVLGAVRVVKAFTRENQEHARFERHSHGGVAARLRVAAQEQSFSLLIAVLTAFGTAAVLFVGARDVRAKALSLGGLLMVMAYLAKLYDPIKTLGKQLAIRERSMASAERALALLDESPDVRERPDARPLVRAIGHVCFRNVSFSYPVSNDGDGNEDVGVPTPVLREVNFDVPAGTRVGLLGKTGAGKTTLINLLSRFYDPDDGQILLDGSDLREYRLADLRSQFALVLQEPVLFSTSIAENIAYGRPGASESEIVAAAKAADAHDFILSLADGYQTQVGERGMCLSGGERQRISLARAFLKDAPILVLDEPTSSVDLKTESQIMVAMDRLMQGRTAFMIAHRPATLANCDMLLRVEDGRVFEATETSPPQPAAFPQGERIPASIVNP